MALLLVLGIVVLLATMAVSFHDQMLTRLGDARMRALDAKALGLARSGVHLASLILKMDVRKYLYLHKEEAAKPDDEKTEPTDKAKEDTKLDEIYQRLAQTETEGFPVEDGRLAIKLTDENALININRATEATLATLFFSIGLKRQKKLELLGETVSEDVSREAARSVVNWRLPENQKVPGGTDDSYYDTLKPPYRPRNGPFETAEELLLVKDISRLAFYGSPKDKRKEGDATDLAAASGTESRSEESAPPVASDRSAEKGEARSDEKTPRVEPLAPLVTVYGDGKVNVNNAPKGVLRVLPGITESPAREALVKTLIEKRPFRDLNEVRSALAQVDPTGGPGAMNALKTSSTVLRVTATGMAGRRQRTVTAVLSKTGTTVKTIFYKEE